MVQQDAVQLARGFLGALSHADFDAWSLLVAPDVVMVFPYSPPGFPKKISGRAPCVAFQRKVADSFASFRWIALDLHACDDAELVFGTASSEILFNTGLRYSNEYCLIFRIRGGEVSEFYEYFDPLRLMAAFDRAPGA